MGRNSESAQVLIICGGLTVHEAVACGRIVAEMLREDGFEVDLRESLEILEDRPALERFDVIVPNWTAGEIPDRQAENLCAAVEAGTGLAGWHGMTASFANRKYQWMCGGAFLGHPGGQKRYRVRIEQRDHELMRGLEDFEAVSEQYYMLVDPRVDVLASTRFDLPEQPWLHQVAMPVIWTGQWGAGRVFYTALGHCAKEFERAEVREVLRRGIAWCRKM